MLHVHSKINLSAVNQLDVHGFIYEILLAGRRWWNWHAGRRGKVCKIFGWPPVSNNPTNQASLQFSQIWLSLCLNCNRCRSHCRRWLINRHMIVRRLVGVLTGWRLDNGRLAFVAAGEQTDAGQNHRNSKNIRAFWQRQFVEPEQAGNFLHKNIIRVANNISHCPGMTRKNNNPIKFFVLSSKLWTGVFTACSILAESQLSCDSRDKPNLRQPSRIHYHVDHRSAEAAAGNNDTTTVWTDIRALGMEGRGWTNTKASYD